MGHASPDRQKDQGKQARQGSKRQGKEKRTCLLIDMSIPNEKNKRETLEKLLKYKDLKIEIEIPWKLKQQLSQWSLVLSALSRRGLKTTSD